MTTETDSSERAKPDVSAVMDAVRDAMATWDIAGDYPPIESTWLVQLAAIAACEAWAAVKHEVECNYWIRETRKQSEARTIAEIDCVEAQQDADALAEALREDAQHVHIIDHHQTRTRIPFEECPSVFCEMRRELLAAHDARKGAQ